MTTHSKRTTATLPALVAEGQTLGVIGAGVMGCSIAYHLAGYSTYVPDGMLAVGPVAGVPGFYSAAGCSGGGVAMAGGVGEALAQMITGSQPACDLKLHDPARFGSFDPFSAEWGQRCANARSCKTTG